MLGSIVYIGDMAGGSEQSLKNSLPSWGLVVVGGAMTRYTSNNKKIYK